MTTGIEHPTPRARACMLAYTFYESDNRVRRYAESLVRQGYEVDAIVLRKDGQPRYEVLQGVRVCRIQARQRNEKGKLGYALKIAAFFVNSALFLSLQHLRRPYDLVHVHSVPDFEVFAALPARLLGARVILDIHDIVPEFYASKFGVDAGSLTFRALVLLEKASAAFADHVIIANHLFERTLLSRSVRQEKCTTLLNYPDPALFHRRPRPDGKDSFVMLYPGTVNRHQGLDLAVQAFAQVKDTLPAAQFHIYGDGPMLPELERLISSLGLQGRVLLKGMVPSEQIAAVMAAADLGIVPKRNDRFGGDAFSTKILEFMALGVPVVAAATRVDRYYFRDDLLRFFEPGSATDLAAAMGEMAGDAQLRRRLAANALDFVADYTWDKKEALYLSLVKGLVGRGGAAPSLAPGLAPNRARATRERTGRHGGRA